MKNYINKNYMKSSSKLIIHKKNGNLHVVNKSNKRERIIFIMPIIAHNHKMKFNSDIETVKGENCNIKFINKRREVFYRLEQNSCVYFSNLPRLSFLGISFEPNSEYIIRSLSFNTNNADEEIFKYFKNNILVICPGYPSYNNKYACAFIHSRVSEYQKVGLNVDIAVVNDLYIHNSELYNFEGIEVCRTGYNQIRTLLLNKHYDKILVHFPVPTYYRILDAVDLSNTSVILYSHGVDTLYHDYVKIGAPYFSNKFEMPDFMKSTIKDRDEGIQRFNNRVNFMFVFATRWNKEYSERLMNIKYNNYQIIPCFIDNFLFSYNEKDEELRKKILIIRPQNNLKSYSMDINVRVILELSHRKCFKDIQFSIYGDGEMHDILLEPLRRFDNVHIHKGFISHEDIAKLHQEHGIALFASRFDSQGVSACEAAMSGNVVISSKGIGTEEVIDPSIGTYCETENYKEYADLIEKIYYNPQLFKKMSKEMHESVMKTCSYNVSLKKDIELIRQFNDKETFNIPTLKKNPLLSISVASYNVEKYIIQLICSIIRSKHASELEILIVNDGSKDNTVKVVKNFIKKYYKGNGQSIIRVIDKENGGHGSTINKGIEVATGKYFKLLDGDDYFISEELDKLVEKLQNEDSDLVLTNYVEDFSCTGVYNRTRLYEELVPGIKYRLEDITLPGYGFESWGPLLHTSTYKTKILKDANFKIDEHCFYVDMEYNLIGFIKADTVTYYSFDVYSYYLGRNGQSVSPESFKKNVLQHEKVCLRVVDEYIKNKNILPYGKRKYIVDKLIVHLCKTQYDIVTCYFKNGHNFRHFNSQLKKYPEIYNNNNIVGKMIKLHRVTNGHLIWMNNILRKIKRR